MWKLLSATEINKLPFKFLGYYSTINNIIIHIFIYFFSMAKNPQTSFHKPNPVQV